MGITKVLLLNEVDNHTTITMYFQITTTIGMYQVNRSKASSPTARQELIDAVTAEFSTDVVQPYDIPPANYSQLPQTGQTTSHDSYDDGNLKAGYSGTRFVDNGDNTITDNATGLMWAKKPEDIANGCAVKTQTKKGQWTTSTAYIVGDVVYDRYDSPPIPDWSEGTAYTSGTFVKVSSVRYKCIQSHTASDRQPGYGVGWASFWSVRSINYWNVGTTYNVDDEVTDGTYRYVCISGHTSTYDDQPPYGVNWATYWTQNAVSDWAQNQTYTATNIVKNSGTFYTCTQGHYSGNEMPGGGYYGDTTWTDFWQDLTVASWDYNSHAYVVGNRVYNYDGITTSMYECIQNHTSDSGHAMDYNGTWWYSYWKKIVPVYVCIVAHTSDSTTEPYWGSGSSNYWTEGVFISEDLSGPYPDFYRQHLKHCHELSWLGHTDWRVPNAEEMMTIITHEYAASGTHTYDSFTNVQTSGYGSYYITSTNDPSQSGYNVMVDCSTGHIIYQSSDGSRFWIRPVRRIT